MILHNIGHSVKKRLASGLELSRVSSRSRLGYWGSRSRSRSRLAGIFQCLGLVSVSRLNVSGLVSVSAMKVSSASLHRCHHGKYHFTLYSSGILREFLVHGKPWALLQAGLREVQAADVKFTHRLKIRFFAPQGRLIAPIHVKLGMDDGQVGPLGCAAFLVNFVPERARFFQWASDNNNYLL